MGKNFSCNNSSGKRKKSDFYETPYSMTQQFLDTGHFPTSSLILEPAAGNGAIVKVLKENGHDVISYDIEKNFLTEIRNYTYLITNPPFSLADKFILKAKEIVTNKFAMLLPLSYLHGKRRYDKIWTDKIFPLSDVYVFTRYPLLGDPLREDGKYKTGMMVYAWYVWSQYYKEDNPHINWIDNNKFVLNSKEIEE